jgi:hypothetical protein
MKRTQLVKSVEFKVFASDNRDYQTFRCKPSQGFYTPECIELVKAEFIAQLQQGFPEAIFKVIPTGKNKFTVVHDCGNA